MSMSEITAALEENTALREELAALRAENEIRPLAPVMLSDSLLDVLESESSAQSLAKVRADAIRSIMDTEYSCETPNGDIAWSSRAIEEHASQIEAGL